MYILYYVTENLQISFIEVETLDQEIIIPENLSFIALRKGINFINEPHQCIDFTHLERLSIAGRLDDINLFKESPFRLKNSKLSPLCQIDLALNLTAYFAKGEHLIQIFTQIPEHFKNDSFVVTEFQNGVELTTQEASITTDEYNFRYYINVSFLDPKPDNYKIRILSETNPALYQDFRLPEDFAQIPEIDAQPFLLAQKF